MPDKPSTPRQRSYLATLAQQAGRSIPQPSSLTSAEASKLIRELKAGPRRRDLPTGRDLTKPTALATAPTDDEAPRRDYPGRDDAPRGDGKRTVLASYELDGHDRQIVGQTTHGNKRRIWDQGLTGPDTTLIASNYRGTSLSELQALIANYTERAAVCHQNGQPLPTLAH